MEDLLVRLYMPDKRVKLKSITVLLLASKIIYLFTDLVVEQAIQGLPLLGFCCVLLPAFQFVLLWGSK